VTMRQIAERLLPEAATGTTYVTREIVSMKGRPLRPPTASFHLFCSALNPGAVELMEEVSLKCSFQVKLESESTGKTCNGLHITTNVANLAKSDHMLLYLNGQTWTRGPESAALGDELLEAMRLDVHVQLAHEMPTVYDRQLSRSFFKERFGCEFDTFFRHPKGATPPKLLKRGLYREIAVPLKGGPWREASMALMGMVLSMSKEEVVAAQEGGNVFGVDTATLREATERIGALASATKRASGFKALASAAERASRLRFMLRSRSRWGVRKDATPGAAGEPVPNEDDHATHTTTATFGTGPFGMIIRKQGDRVFVASVDSTGQAMEQGVQQGSAILEVGGASVRGLAYQEVRNLLTNSERPLTIVLDDSAPPPQDSYTQGRTTKVSKAGLSSRLWQGLPSCKVARGLSSAKPMYTSATASSSVADPVRDASACAEAGAKGNDIELAHAMKDS